MHNIYIYINKILYIVIMCTYFNVTASSTGSLNFYFVKGTKIMNITNLTKSVTLMIFLTLTKHKV
jgi:hypothetical protein